MTKISSNWTGYYKKVFPVLWFGFLAFFFVVGLFSEGPRQNVTFVLIPVVMAVFGFFLMRKLTWDLADEVYDCGDVLLIKNHGEEISVPLANIMNVSSSNYMNPPRITLKLIKPSSFGEEIAFSPIRRFSFNPFARNRVADDLILRVHQARTRGAV